MNELAESISPKLLETKINVEGLIKRIEGNYRKNVIISNDFVTECIIGAVS